MDTVPGSTYNAKTPCDRAGLQCGYGYEGYVGSRNKEAATGSAMAELAAKGRY